VDLSGENITVNGIAPGFIKTRMSVLADGSDEFENENFKNIYIKNKKIPIGRYGTPEDISKVVLFLASSLSNYINGQIINVDGGVTSTF
jgi:3-oxoacyl-[acyl-carrier protein] reductase